MKKIFTASLAFSLALSMGAEDVRILGLGIGTPGWDEPMLIGLGISPDGRYVCGPTEQEQGVFVYDLTNSTCSVDIIEEGELRNVNNAGLAIGFAGSDYDGSNIGISYSWNGEMTSLDVPDSRYKYVLGEDLTDDGRIRIGSLVRYGYVTDAAYSVDGGEWTLLPMPPADQLGRFTEGSMAKAISGDGKYIIGHADNFGPIILWTRNDDGTYDVDPLFTRYCALDEAEEAEKPLAGMFPQAISNNGRLVLTRCAKYVYDEDGELYDILWFPAVYDTETAELKMYDEPQAIDEGGMGLNCSAIADDGTFVGIIGNAAIVRSSGTFIMKAGATQAELLTEAFPKYDEMLGDAELYAYSVATGISADARYIIGYAYYSEDFNDDMMPAYYATYVIDTFAGTAVEGVAAPAATEEIYSIDGLRRSEMKPGLNIIRSADGSVRKLIRK